MGKEVRGGRRACVRVCECVHACVHACVRACPVACVRARVPACVPLAPRTINNCLFEAPLRTPSHLYKRNIFSHVFGMASAVRGAPNQIRRQGRIESDASGAMPRPRRSPNH